MLDDAVELRHAESSRVGKVTELPYSRWRGLRKNAPTMSIPTTGIPTTGIPTMPAVRRGAKLRRVIMSFGGAAAVIVAKLPGDAITKDELSERALRRPREPYDRSVDVHISNLRQKLVAAGGGIEIETVRAIGYRLRPPA